jgi:hypothetical protein
MLTPAARLFPFANGVPAAQTKVFRLLDAQALAARLRHLDGFHSPRQGGVVAVGGKTLRRSKISEPPLTQDPEPVFRRTI